MLGSSFFPLDKENMRLDFELRSWKRISSDEKGKTFP
jgi:hypothetical protein